MKGMEGNDVKRGEKRNGEVGEESSVLVVITE